MPHAHTYGYLQTHWWGKNIKINFLCFSESLLFCCRIWWGYNGSMNKRITTKFLAAEGKVLIHWNSFMPLHLVLKCNLCLDKLFRQGKTHVNVRCHLKAVWLALCSDLMKVQTQSVQHADIRTRNFILPLWPVTPEQSTPTTHYSAHSSTETTWLCWHLHKPQMKFLLTVQSSFLFDLTEKHHKWLLPWQRERKNRLWRYSSNISGDHTPAMLTAYSWFVQRLSSHSQPKTVNINTRSPTVCCAIHLLAVGGVTSPMETVRNHHAST